MAVIVKENCVNPQKIRILGRDGINPKIYACSI